MPYTPEQKNAFDMVCYGMLESEVNENLLPQAESMGKEMLIMSMLSDVQELIERNQKEHARMLINQAKHVICEFPENKMDAYLKARKAEVA